MYFDTFTTVDPVSKIKFLEREFELIEKIWFRGK